MSLIDGLRYRVRALFGAGRHAREAGRELQFHLDLEAAQREHDGATPDEAEFAARRQLMLVGFAIAALAVTAVGLYGVISYSVAQRTREIGIRMALGASPNTVRRRVARQGLGLTVTGVCVGAAAAGIATRILRSMLFGVAPGDPTVLAAVAILLAAVALLASWLRARRAAAVDPLIAIRTE